MNSHLSSSVLWAIFCEPETHMFQDVQFERMVRSTFLLDWVLMLQDLYEKIYHLFQGQMQRTDPVFASQFIDTDELLSIFAQN